MTLKEKFKFIKDKNLIKDRPYLYLIPIFFALMILLSSLFVGSFFIFNKEKAFLWLQGLDRVHYQGHYIFIHIVLSISLIISFFIFMTFLTKLLINKYFYLNIFRCLKWVKIMFLLTGKFSLFKKFNASMDTFSQQDFEYIKWAQKNGFVIVGNKAISYRYKNYYKKCDDLNFVANSSNVALKSVKTFAGSKLEKLDLSSYKISLNGKKMFFSMAEYIPSKFISWNILISIPTFNWTINKQIMDIIELFVLWKNDKYSEKIINDIEEAFFDLTFLIHKSKIWKINSYVKQFKVLYVSLFFKAYFTNIGLLNIYDENDTKAFIDFIEKYCNRYNHSFELISFFNEILVQIQKDKTYKPISDSMQKLINEKKHLEIKRRFLNIDQKIQFMTNHYPEEIKNEILLLYLNGLLNVGEIDNEIDSRIILIKEINKSIEGNYE
ncbi:MAG4530 family protein [Mycoplasmopsis primatum]|uniref:MAG4530 family protein n=1 Tax=Mycoplasmopsis primatum TaxID=55604 RepID=UPI0004980579|nr:hypothetical protein [Mycoplasmopsis primatum]